MLVNDHLLEHLLAGQGGALPPVWTLASGRVRPHNERAARLALTAQAIKLRNMVLLLLDLEGRRQAGHVVE